MKAPQPPRLDERREDEFFAELRERAQAWKPTWALADGEHDFGRALLQIAARFSSEVAEHLDAAGDKMRRGFLDWLGIPRKAARPARLPVVFKLVDAAPEAVLAPAPVKMQADAGGVSVVFETEHAVQVVPGRLAAVVGVDAEQDAYYLPPPGLSDLQPAEALPTQWRLKSFASADATTLQLDPESGLAAGIILAANAEQYTITKVDKDLVTIEPPLEAELAESTLVSKVATFSPFGEDPFGAKAHNWQEHALYLGDDELLNIEAQATIEVVGAMRLREGYTWEYVGKQNPNDQEVRWLPLAPDNDRQKNISDALVLTKPNGAIEKKEISGKNTRWIRARRKTIVPPETPFTSGVLSIRINASGCPDGLACPPPDAPVSPAADAMANTTPLVLESVFYPLGKEPRQFDAFYLGSQEAFSKKGATVQLCFKMAEPSFAALSSLRTGPDSDQFLAGVAADGYLYLFTFDPVKGVLTPYPNRDPLRPPSPRVGGSTVDGPPVTLDQNSTFRAPVWMVGTSMYVAVSAKSAVWIWREDTVNPANSGWESAGLVEEQVSDPKTPIEGLVYLADAQAGRLFALRESKLFVRNLNDTNGTWEVVKTQTKDNKQVKLNAIAPILIQDVIFLITPILIQGPILYGWNLSTDLNAIDENKPVYFTQTLREGNLSAGLVAVGEDNKLYGIQLKNIPLEGTCTELLADVAPDVAPAAVLSGDQLTAVAVSVAVGKEQSKRKLLAVRSKPPTFAESGHPEVGPDSKPSMFTELDHSEVDLGAIDIVGQSIDMNITGGHLTFVVCVKPNVEMTTLVAWSPFEPEPDTVLFTATFPAHVGTPAGAPTLLPQHVIVPTTSSHALVAPFDLTRRLSLTTTLRSSLVTTAATDQLVTGDRVAIPVARDVPTHKLETVGVGVAHGGKTAYEFAIQPHDGNVFVYPAAVKPFTGTVEPSALDRLMIDSADTNTIDKPILLITTDKSTQLYYVRAFDGTTKIAVLDRNLDVTDPAVPPATVNYKVPNPTTAELLPSMSLDPATIGNWDTTLLDRTRLVFPGADPEQQIGTVFQAASTGKPMLVVLPRRWSTPPPDIGGGKLQFKVEAPVGDWVAQLGTTFTNPELSWEYWNGKGWWKLPTSDETQNLKTTGAVRFKVPPDIAASDWAGRTNFWIRARLVGGDYGREKVTAKTTTISDKVTEQTIERSTDGIRAPQVLELHISYAVCTNVPPTYVLAQDSGSFRDQSDANKTPGAIVEAFVPLALTLERLASAAAPAHPSDDCPPACGDSPRQATAAQPAPGAAAVPASQPAGGRAIFIGVAGLRPEAPANVLSGAPVNVLLLVDERAHTSLAPMTIDALAADRFVPIVADDATRALGESGLLSMAFDKPPTPRELFGQTLTWLRLTPKAGANPASWNPSLRGAYLNAAWASAAETMTRELLGSSDGRPNMTVRLARPPVLDHTPELRVKEPLGDEERKTLLKLNAAKVVREKQPLTDEWIDWVLWEQVADPSDEPAEARVYALDEGTGDIRFGDGKHGRIPPIGRDAIVAFRYQRTEPGLPGSATVPGNLVAARAPLNLVSPVATVESVTAADNAAGGAPPEDDERVLRFGFSRMRHRDRVITLQDLEDLAVQSSPDIVQARAMARRGSIRLVVVIKGRNPVPTAAQARELRRLLLASAPMSLSAPGALSIESPQIQRLRIQLTLRVERLDQAGELGPYVRARLVDFFDTATGGIDKDGWALGMSPSEDDIAFALIDAPKLDSIEDVTLYQIAPDGSEQSWPGALKPAELAMLHDDWLRIRFETAEVQQ